MPRHRRHTPAGMVFHVINRGVGRQTEQDYAAFERVLAEAWERGANSMPHPNQHPTELPLDIFTGLIYNLSRARSMRAPLFDKGISPPAPARNRPPQRATKAPQNATPVARA